MNMAFRRSSNFKRNFGSTSSRFRRRSSGVHNVTRPTRWSAANFSLKFTNITDSPMSPTNTVIVMAKIGNLFRGDSQINLQELARSIQIGGITFDWQFGHVVQNVTGGALPNFTDITWLNTLVLCTDRLAADDSPVAIDADWTNTQVPISLAVAQTSIDQDVTYPTRIHWRRSRITDVTYSRASANDTEAPLPTVVNVVPQCGSANLRLRLRLTDEQVLSFHFTTRQLPGNAPTGINELYTHVYLNGTLYYRAT